MSFACKPYNSPITPSMSTHAAMAITYKTQRNFTPILLHTLPKCLVFIAICSLLQLANATAVTTQSGPFYAIRWGGSLPATSNQVPLVSICATSPAFWKTGAAIKQGDLCYYGNATYQSLQTHTSSALSEPGIGANWAAYWSISSACFFQVARWTPVASIANQLKALPSGRRALLLQGIDMEIYQHPEDRCRDSLGTIDGLSKNPSVIGAWGRGYYKGTLGGDGLNSGYSSIWFDHWTENAVIFAKKLVQDLADNGAEVDFLIFDTEMGMNEWLPVTPAWQQAVMGDPRWPALKAKLDALVRIRTGEPAAEFPVTAAGFDGKSVNFSWTDWDAQMNANMADGINMIFNEFKARWPQLKCSDYAFAGWKANDGVFDLNGHTYYFLNVVGSHASWSSYGWLNQASDLTAGYDPWQTLLFEQNKARGSARSGYGIQPWISYPTFSEGSTRWKADFDVPYPFQPNPCWKENVRHLMLLGADPLLYWAAREKTPIISIDLPNNEIVFSWNPSDNLPIIHITGSSSNDGFYNIESVHLESSTVVRFGLKQPLKSDVVDGVVDFGSSDEIDQHLESLLTELNSQVGMELPRETIASKPIDYGSKVLVSGLRHGNLATYRISVSRYPDPTSADWATTIPVTILEDGQPVASEIIPAGELGIYYTTDYHPGSVISAQIATSASTPTPSPTPTVIPTPTPLPTPIDYPTPTPSATPMVTPTPAASPTPISPPNKHYTDAQLSWVLYQ